MEVVVKHNFLQVLFVELRNPIFLDYAYSQSCESQPASDRSERNAQSKHKPSEQLYHFELRKDIQLVVLRVGLLVHELLVALGPSSLLLRSLLLRGVLCCWFVIDVKFLIYIIPIPFLPQLLDSVPCRSWIQIGVVQLPLVVQ